MQIQDYLPIALGLFLLGCSADQQSEVNDSDSPTCDGECLDPGRPTWCTQTPAETEQSVHVVGTQPHPDGGLVVVTIAADGTRKLLEFSIDGAVVSNREITGEGAPRALAATPDGLSIITNVDNRNSANVTSTVEHFTYDGDFLRAQPVDLDGLTLTTAQSVDGGLATAGSRVLDAGGHSDIWVGMLDATGGIAWQHIYDHVGLADQAEAIAFDGTNVAIVGNVQHEEPRYPGDPFPPNQVYFAVLGAYDGALLHQEIVPGEPAHGILRGNDIANYGDGEWALIGTSTNGLLQSTWWTAIADTDGIRFQLFESEIGDNVTESVVTFGDDVIVGGRRGDPIPTASRVVRYAEHLSSLAWEWTAEVPSDSHAEDLIRDMLVVDFNLYVASIRMNHPPVGGGGSYTESLTVCNFRLD